MKAAADLYSENKEFQPQDPSQFEDENVFQENAT